MSMQSECASEVSPILGLLCIDIAHHLSESYGNNWHSYIAASYVKYLEAAGARIVPIWIGRERSYYEQIISKLNGVLIPGGAVFLPGQYTNLDASTGQYTNDCIQSSQYVYEIILQRNLAGDYLPLWGTCLGFQLLFIHATADENVRTSCTAYNDTFKLTLMPDCRSSVLLSHATAELIANMCNVPFARHHHKYCISVASFNAYNLSNDWRILATKKDDVIVDLEFITLVEHKRYPIFGSQFHLERIPYDHLNSSSANAATAIELTQYFARTFVDACRKSTHRFDSAAEEIRHLIWNFTPKFTGKLQNSIFRECYLFERNADYPTMPL